MKHFVPVLVALSVTVPVAPARAQESSAPGAEPCKIVVLNLVGRGLPAGEEELPALLTDTLAGEVEVVSGCDVVSQADILAMLDYEKQKAVCTDGSDSCLAEVGQALGADRVVAGTIGRIGSEYVITARLMNVRQASVERRAEEPVAGGAAALRRGAKNVGRRLFGVADVPLGAAEASAVAPGGGSPTLMWTGAVVGGLGLVAAVGGGVVAGVAEGKLADPAESAKDSAMNDGRIGIGVAAAGGLALVVGGVLAFVGTE